MNGDMKENVIRRGIWLRLCYMIIMIIAFSVAEVVVFAVVAFQFLSSLFTARTNDQLIRLGRNLARYLQQITAYLTFTTEEIPFPFMSWPDEPHDDVWEEDDDPLDGTPETIADATPDDEPDDAKTAAAPPVEDTRQPDDQPETTGDATPDDEPVDERKMADAPAEEGNDQPDDQPAITGAAAEKDDGEDTKAADAPQTAVFADSAAYEKFMGERSKLGGERLLNMLDLPPRLSWLDVGCGTGALSAVIMENCDPAALIGIDSSEQQIDHAQNELGNEWASFRVANATALPFEVDSFDVAVSSYVLNFVPNKQRMMDEMARVVRPEGTVVVSVFDVAGGRQASYPIWELIDRNDPAYHKAEFEKRGWDITHPEALTSFFENAGLEEVSVDSIEIDESFADFDEYWAAMTAMPTSGSSLYINGLDQEGRQKFQDDLKALMPIEPDGSIKLVTGSWVVRGKVPA